MNRSPSERLPDYILPAEGEPACTLSEAAREGMTAAVAGRFIVAALHGIDPAAAGAASIVDHFIKAGEKIGTNLPAHRRAALNEMIAKRSECILFVEGLLGTG